MKVIVSPSWNAVPSGQAVASSVSVSSSAADTAMIGRFPLGPAPLIVGKPRPRSIVTGTVARASAAVRARRIVSPVKPLPATTA